MRGTEIKPGAPSELHEMKRTGKAVLFKEADKGGFVGEKEI